MWHNVAYMFSFETYISSLWFLLLIVDVKDQLEEKLPNEDAIVQCAKGNTDDQEDEYVEDEKSK